MKEIKKLAKEISREVESNGWSIDAHTSILVLLAMIKEIK